MNFQQYLDYGEAIVKGEVNQAPYDDEHMLHYTLLNQKRQNRWLKTGVLSKELKQQMDGLSEPQHWVLITEPWCGDAAHSVPFIYLISEAGDKVSLEIQLRDEGSEIDQYLTNGSKSIPILIARDAKGQDLFTWGPRPQELQAIFLQEKAKQPPVEEAKIILQNWYNQDKGAALQAELTALMQTAKDL